MMRGKQFLVFCLLSISVLLTNCKSGGDLTNAKDLYVHEQYYDAIDQFKKAYSGTKDKSQRAEIANYIGQSYLKNGDYSKAEGWFRKAVNMGYSDPKAHLAIAQTLEGQGKYRDALPELQTYKKEMPSDASIDDQIKFANEALSFESDTFKSRFSVAVFPYANSISNDFAPAMYKNEGMIFTSDREQSTGKSVYGRTGGYFEDLFFLPISKKGKKVIYDTKNVAPLTGNVNSPMNDADAAVDTKGSVMYFTRCNPLKDPNGKAKQPNCVIMSSEKRGKDWSDPTVLPFCTDSAINYGQPALSPDGTKMIFVEDNPNGAGHHDLYLVTYVKRSHTWSDPVNISSLNTPGDEMFPFFKNDTTLYFASDGYAGLGGLDIYMTHGQGTDWAKPKHLSYPVNSGSDDYAITFDSDTSGYFSTNRSKRHDDDIWTFNVAPLVFTLAGVVTNQQGGLPIRGATVVLTNKKTGKKEMQQTDAQGKYKFRLAENTDYEVYSTKTGFFPSDNYKKTTVGLEYNANLKQNMELAPPIITLTIFYDVDKAFIRPDAAKTLDSLIDNVFNVYPNLVVEMGSHTDCRASMHHNDSLSQARSDSAVSYLVRHGVDKERLVAKGYGERMLTNNCSCEPDNVGPGKDCTEAEHQANRRTTVKILRWDYTPKTPANDNNGGNGNDNGGGNGGG
jgi:peptidoglycan-associated lipoprotein